MNAIMNAQADALRRPDTWVEALADYQAKRAVFDGDQDSDAETDRLCDITFAAQDHLLTEVLAPDVVAFATKIGLMKERDLGCPDEWFDALLADVRQLVGGAPADPHMGWMEQRAQLRAEYEASHAANPNGDAAIYRRLSACQRQIMDTPAASRDGLLAKALLVADEHLGPDDTDSANRVLAEAKAMGLVECAI